MNNTNTQFKVLVSGSDPLVDAIIAVMKHSEATNARKFLNLMNSIIDYYLVRASEEQVIYPIIRISHAPQWAREVLLEFLILKLSIYYNADTITQLCKAFSPSYVYLRNPQEERHYREYTKPCKNYIQKISAKLPLQYQSVSGRKNIIVCSQSDLRVSRTDKNNFIAEFYDTIGKLQTVKNLILCQGIGARQVQNNISAAKKASYQIAFDNVFVFYTNNKQINSFEKINLDKWNQLGVGLKNCFVFDFSDKPFCLRDEIRRGKMLSKKLLGISEDQFDESHPHFITFDEDETNFLFDWEKHYEHKLFKDDQLFFSDILGAMLDESDYRIRECNYFSLCFDEDTIDSYKQYLSSKDNEGDYDYSFTWQLDEIKPKIESAIKEQLDSFGFDSDVHPIAVVVDKSAPQCLLDKLKHYLKSIDNGAKVKYYDYSALKAKDGVNGIKESLVFVLQYRPHYVDKPYPKYPNSFDAYSVNEGQYIYDIINGFIFQDMYDWDRYTYDIYKYKLLSSEYRYKTLGAYYKPANKPSSKQVVGEIEFSDECRGTHNITYIEGVYADGKAIHIPETGFVIYELCNGVRKVGRLSDMKDDDGLFPSITKLQKLDDVAKGLVEYIGDQQNRNSQEEQTIRKTLCNQGKITEAERDSSVALWRIVLGKRVNNDNVLDAMNLGLENGEKISEKQFKAWLDRSKEMILPRSRKHQKHLIDHLFGVDSDTTRVYLSIMRNKKAAANAQTKRYNIMLDDFLCKTLPSNANIDVDLFKEIENSDINDLLQLKSVADLKALVDLLCDRIDMKTTKEIK